MCNNPALSPHILKLFIINITQLLFKCFRSFRSYLWTNKEKQRSPMILSILVNYPYLKIYDSKMKKKVIFNVFTIIYQTHFIANAD